MKTFITLSYFLLIGTFVDAQSSEKASTENFSSNVEIPGAATGVDDDFASEDWTAFGGDGSINFSEQTAILFTDEEQRQKTYPEKYELSQLPYLLEDQRLMLALWTLINLYPTQTAQVKVIARKLAQRGIGGQHYLSAFYTYAFADPEIFHFEEGSATYLENPIRLEQKLNSCKELSRHVQSFINTIHKNN